MHTIRGNNLMNRPSLDQLLKYVDCRYTLVSVAARRARQITNEKRLQTKGNKEEHSIKEVSLALRELVEGKITYRHIKNVSVEDNEA